MLRYPGGKTRAIKSLLQILEEEHIDLTNKHIYSAFYGGGSFEKYMHDNYKCIITGNDLFEPLYNFWNVLKNHKDELKEQIQLLHPLSKDNFVKYKSEFTEYKDEIKKAACYFAINRSSFSGSTTSGGYSKTAAAKRFTQSSINRIDTYDLSNITFNNMDYNDFINNVVPDGEFMFLDPPYYIKSKLYGVNGDLHKNFNHKKLYKLLSTKNNWMLCYNNDDYIIDLYSNIDDVIMYEANWAYGMNKSKKSNEIVILKK